MKNAKILIIDDEQKILQATTSMLKKDVNEYEIFSTISGVTGVEIANKEKPDLILLDLVMPDSIHGDEVIRQLKKRKIQTRVVICTGEGKNLKDVVKYMKMGACNYLVKPIVVQKLFHVVRETLAFEAIENSRLYHDTPFIDDLVNKIESLNTDLNRLKKELKEKSNEYEVIEENLKIKNISLIQEKNRLEKDWNNLNAEKQKLIKQGPLIKRQERILDVIIRLLFLIVSTAISVGVYKFNMVDQTQFLFLLLGLFGLLSFPINKITTLATKFGRVSTKK